MIKSLGKSKERNTEDSKVSVKTLNSLKLYKNMQKKKNLSNE